MKKADFYILDGNQEQDRQLFLCKLLNRILQAKHAIYLYCIDEEHAHATSQLLWQFSETSFLANKLVTQELKAPISIGWPEQHHFEHCGVIVNLSEHIPTDAQSFERIAEIVIQQNESLQGSRERYKTYRSAGFEISHNDMRKNT
jgi:DNA polymerase-3 subunit chi